MAPALKEERSKRRRKMMARSIVPFMFKMAPMSVEERRKSKREMMARNELLFM